MSEAKASQDSGVAKRLRLSTRITGIIFWGAVLTGILVVAVFIKQNESDFRARQDYQMTRLLLLVENTLAPKSVTTDLAGKIEPLRLAIDTYKEDVSLLGAEISIGDNKTLIGSAPENAVIRTISSDRVVDKTWNHQLQVTAYFDPASNNIYTSRKNLIVFLGMISFAFGLIMNRILKSMLTNPVDRMIESAAAYAGGDKSVRFDETKNDEFGFMSGFINKALDSSESMHRQLETSVHEQRDAKERAEEALVELESAKDRLVQSEKLASLGQLTAGIAHEIKNPLNFINNFSETSVELCSELNETLAPHLKNMDASVRDEIVETLEDLSADLNTITKHGKRADSIVKNMLMHSRSDGGERTPTDINALVTEASGLAYHGERATDREFQVDLDSQLADDLDLIMVIPQDITRVLINLLSNAFYATKKRKNGTQDTDYVPAVAITTAPQDGGVEIRIRDNGTGISEANKKNLFAPFFTTKPTGQGTGLGLSISHDIITKQHDGIIGVNSVEGEGTEFIMWLPGFNADGTRFKT